ncbi:hypothetical protein D9V29_13855 [Mycetocola manganoxydans]|uniref:Uncharacterized protein n=1 Tax=Mycetocola manganoxydans TaxID=699879 RepID=A0A3L6ZK98_9MICO|nr:hypothetical protein D9V29_13855 [Mycetocola manganoxydans]
MAALALVLSGCSIEEYVVNSHEESFGTYTAAAEDWVGGDMPEWIPTDATGIRRIATRDERISTIRIETTSAPRGDCEEQPREGVPVLTATWSAAERPDSVLVCDGYEIMPTENGWLGWLYNPEEPGRLS